MLTEDGIRIKAGTKHIPYPYYCVPPDIKEGIYSVKAEVTDTEGNVIYTDEAFFEVSGRLYGLELYNVSSENIEWKGVFDEPDAGFFVSALPLLDGDSPNIKNMGMLKSGYMWNFSIYTAGSRMQDAASSVRVITGFTHISPDGTRKPVDIWYEEYGENGQENFVKPDNEIYAVRDDENGQTWAFEYSLPDTWYCVGSGFDMEGYLDLYDGCTFEEDFWEKEGYLAVNFRIEALALDGTVIMSYSNLRENVEAGMCDMWESEGFDTEKTE